MKDPKHFITKIFKFKRILKVGGYAFKKNAKLLEILVKPYKNGCQCPKCDRRCEIVSGAKSIRKWIDVPSHGIEVSLIYHPKEIDCPTHGRIQENIPWADEFSRHSYRFEYLVVRFAQMMTEKAGAELLKIPKSTYSDLLRRIIRRVRYGHKVRGLKTMGVDEIAYCRGRKYATLIYDLDKSKVVWIGKGKGSDTFRKFLDTLSDFQKSQIKYACCDMARAYTSVILEDLKKTQLIIDRFHIVKALNEALDEVRKEEWRIVSKENKLYLKGLRWILLKSKWNRTKGQTRTANSLRNSNNRIFRAWVLKDEFEHFWEYTYVGSAKAFIADWTKRALLSRLQPMIDFVKTFRAHQEYILPYLKTRITNAKGEGLNRIAQLVKQRACGFANLDAFSDIIFLVIGDVDIPNGIDKRFHTI